MAETSVSRGAEDTSARRGAARVWRRPLQRGVRIGLLLLLVGAPAPGAGAAQEWITGSTARGVKLAEIPRERLAICDVLPARRFSMRFLTLDCAASKLEIAAPGMAQEIDLATGDGSLTADLVLFEAGVAVAGGRRYQTIRAGLGDYRIELELDFEPGMSAITGVVGTMPAPWTLRVVRGDDGRRWEWSGGEAPAATPSLSLALVLDSSGSMSGNDPRGMRKLGAGLLVDRLPPGARVSVIDFDASARVRLSDSADGEAAKRAIQAIDADGGTAICRGLAAAQRELEQAAAGRRAAVLFTDGQSNDSCDAGEFAARGWPIYAVGLSEAADGARLDRLARQTRGAYVHARSPADLQRLFDLVASDLLAEATIADVAGTARPGGVERIRFFVDRSVRWLVSTLSWPGSDLDLVLVSPSGVRHAAAASGAVASSYESLRLADPEEGTWTAEVASIDVPPAGEPFRLRAGGDSPIRLEVETTGTPAKTGDPIALTGLLRDFPAGTPEVSVEVETPQGERQSAQAARGATDFRVSFYDTFRPGPYTFRWVARVGDIVRHVSRTVFVGGAPFNPRRGRILRVEGVYLRWDRGRIHGMRPGMKVTLYRGGRRVGEGQVLDVRARESDLEVFSLTGIAELRRGDLAEVDRRDWIGTGK